MNLKTGLYKTAELIKNIILDIFYPRRCIMCNSHVNFHNSISMCHECKLKSKNESIVIKDDKKYFEEAICALEYSDHIKNAMGDFKFRSIRYLDKTFAWCVYNNVKNRKFLNEVSFICPVPLHPMREREYNQSELIAKELSRYTGIPVASDALLKIRNLTPLSKMNYIKRNNMIRNAFTFNPKYDFSGKTICLIDDIYTTSATVNECSRILKLYGAKQVYVLCPCHAQKKNGENENAHTDFANN